MTSKEANKAAEMGIPVVHHSASLGKDILYKRIAEIRWCYRNGEKSVFLALEQEGRENGGGMVVPLERVSPANPELFQIQMEIDVKMPERAVPVIRKEEPETVKGAGEGRKFRKPTVEEVAAYALEELYEIDAAAFVDHYDACGWVVGKNKPMKDWRAAVRQWVRRKKEFEKPSTEPVGSFDTDAFFAAALNKSYGDL